MAASEMGLDYRDLTVYKEAFELGVWARMFVRNLDYADRKNLGDQILRSSRSVPANIAEAWRKRMYPAYFTSKITDAEAEAAETQVWLDYALSDGLISAEMHARHIQTCHRILSQLVNLRKSHRRD